MPKTPKPKHTSTADETKENLPEPSDNTGLRDLLMDGLKDIYWAENQLTKALPVMEAATSNAELAGAIASHLEETAGHVARLEDIFALLNEKAQAKKCDAMEGLTKEGEATIEDTEQGTVARDTAIITASRKVEHYEIAAYTGLKSLAEKLGLTEVATILTQTLAEEEAADQTLSGISDSL
jgi:ferritin-like metal-binding protein YciE